VDLADQLMQPGQLTICSAFPRTRFAERDAQGQPFGVDIDIGLAIAEQLGLEPVIVELPFEELIDAVVDGRCDVTISGHFITAARLERIDLIPYREGSVNVVVRAGNPLGIEQLTDLCGRTAAIVEGTIYFDIVRGLGDYSGGGIDQQCEQAGQPAVNLAQFATEGDAEAAFADGDADAFIGNEAIALDRPSEFELSPAALPRLRNGIGHRLGAAALDLALRTALRELIGDGTYAAIFERYGVSGIEVTELP
jgi:ABC-type amino acid transport substrate-binding protein